MPDLKPDSMPKKDGKEWRESDASKSVTHERPEPKTTPPAERQSPSENKPDTTKES